MASLPGLGPSIAASRHVPPVCKKYEKRCGWGTAINASCVQEIREGVWVGHCHKCFLCAKIMRGGVGGALP